MDIRFIHPFTSLVAGPTGSGKTTLVKKLLQDQKFLVKPPFRRVIYFYQVWQDIFEEMVNDGLVTEFKLGIPNKEYLDLQLGKKEPTLYIIDDAMNEKKDLADLNKLFSVHVSSL